MSVHIFWSFPDGTQGPLFHSDCINDHVLYGTMEEHWFNHQTVDLSMGIRSVSPTPGKSSNLFADTCSLNFIAYNDLTKGTPCYLGAIRAHTKFCRLCYSHLLEGQTTHPESKVHQRMDAVAYARLLFAHGFGTDRTAIKTGWRCHKRDRGFSEPRTRFSGPIRQNSTRDGSIEDPGTITNSRHDRRHFFFR